MPTLSGRLADADGNFVDFKIVTDDEAMDIYFGTHRHPFYTFTAEDGGLTIDELNPATAGVIEHEHVVDLEHPADGGE